VVVALINKSRSTQSSEFTNASGGSKIAAREWLLCGELRRLLMMIAHHLFPPRKVGQVLLGATQLAEITFCDPAVGSGAFPVGHRSKYLLIPFFTQRGRSPAAALE